MLQKVSLYITLLISFSRYFMKDQVNFSNLLLSVVRPSYSKFLLFDPLDQLKPNLAWASLWDGGLKRRANPLI